MNETDLVMYKYDGGLYSGGYLINSINQNESPMKTENDHPQQGGNVATLFKDLAVPSGLFLLQQNINTILDLNTGKENAIHKDNVDETSIGDSLFDKLLKMAEYKKIKPTRKHKTSPLKKTRRK